MGLSIEVAAYNEKRGLPETLVRLRPPPDCFRAVEPGLSWWTTTVPTTPQRWPGTWGLPWLRCPCGASGGQGIAARWSRVAIRQSSWVLT